MAGDSSDPTRRKHHRSLSDDENDSQEPSKRRKHRHHRHHRHHHRHHHRSKKQDTVEDGTQIEAGIEGKEKRQGDRNASDSDTDNTAAKGPPIGGIGPGANGLSLGIDYDMEEGEIIEEVEGSAVGDDWKKKGFDSDIEAGKVKGSIVEKVNVSQEVEESVNRKSKEFGILGIDRADREEISNRDRKKHNDAEKSTKSRSDYASNGEFVHHYFKDVLPVEEDQRTGNKYVCGYDLRPQSESGGSKRRGVSNSPSCSRDLEEGYGRQPLKSPGQSRARSRSQSSLREASQSDTPREHDDACLSKRKHRSDSDDERVTKPDRDYRHGSRDLLRDRETEHSSSYNRHNSQVDRHHSRETRERDREGSREIDRDRTRERERTEKGGGNGTEIGSEIEVGIEIGKRKMTGLLNIINMMT